MVARIKKGDEVIIIAGKHRPDYAKGIMTRGVVTQVFKDEDKVIVEGCNLVKKHERANPNLGSAGGIVQKEMPIHISNVALYNPETGRADKVGVKVLEDGRKVRYFKSNDEVIDS